jgi:pyruvate/2-oxoglutarate dehydrogenase complex dihydrolipoamide acyltransferase (E2) component
MVGETVAENEPLIEIETDKVTVEVASPGAGILREIMKGEQEEIAPGEVLGRIEAAVGVGLGRPLALGEAADASDRGGGGGLSQAWGARTGVLLAAMRGQLPVGAAGQAARGWRTATAPLISRRNRLSPAVRRLLTENAIDPAAIRGTGRVGGSRLRTCLRRLRRAKGSGRGRGRRAAPATYGRWCGRGASARRVAWGVAPSRLCTPPSMLPQRQSRIPHTAVRKRVAEHMVQSLLHTAPHVTTVFEADMTAVLAHRAQTS